MNLIFRVQVLNVIYPKYGLFHIHVFDIYKSHCLLYKNTKHLQIHINFILFVNLKVTMNFSNAVSLSSAYPHNSPAQGSRKEPEDVPNACAFLPWHAPSTDEEPWHYLIRRAVPFLSSWCNRVPWNAPSRCRLSRCRWVPPNNANNWCAWTWWCSVSLAVFCLPYKPHPWTRCTRHGFHDDRGRMVTWHWYGKHRCNIGRILKSGKWEKWQIASNYKRSCPDSVDSWLLT